LATAYILIISFIVLPLFFYALCSVAGQHSHVGGVLILGIFVSDLLTRC
jgi:hypothetical protein